MHVVIFEGSQWPAFAPFTLTRPVFQLVSGAGTLLQKQVRATKPTRLTLWVRDEMVDYVRQRVVPTTTTLGVPTAVNTPLDGEPALMFAGRTLHLSNYERPAGECVFVEDDGLIQLAYAVRPGLSHDDVLTRSAAWQGLKDLPHAMPQARFPRHWGDLVAWNEESLLADSIHWRDPAPQGGHLIQPEDVHARPGVVVMPGAVLDASRGPILLDEACVIGANAVLEGPLYVGPRSRVLPLTYVHGGTTIGPNCRVAGEVSNSLFIGHTNKAHHGYVGDSYLGEWVNCGAGTTTSNLKSTYGEIRLTVGSRTVESGRMFLGAGIGDHAKLATGTLLPSGAYVGVGTMLAISERAPKFVPSFRFVTDDANEPTAADKAIEIAARMGQRRGKTFDALDRTVFEYASHAAEQVER